MWNKISQDYYSHFAGHIEVGVNQLAKQQTGNKIRDIITKDSRGDKISLIFFPVFSVILSNFTYIHLMCFYSLMIN